MRFKGADMAWLKRRSCLFATITLSVFLCFGTASIMAQDTNPASGAHMFSGTNSRRETLTVVGIEAASNSVMLRGRSGKVMKVEVNPEVGDVKRLKIGDRMRVMYARALLLHVDKLDVKGIRKRVDTETTTPIVKGGATSIHRVQVVATITSVDARRRVLTLRGPTRTVTVIASSALSLGNLKVGDSIRADYTEATAFQVTRDGAPLR